MSQATDSANASASIKIGKKRKLFVRSGSEPLDKKDCGDLCFTCQKPINIIFPRQENQEKTNVKRKYIFAKKKRHVSVPPKSSKSEPTSQDDHQTVDQNAEKNAISSTEKETSSKEKPKVVDCFDYVTDFFHDLNIQ